MKLGERLRAIRMEVSLEQCRELGRRAMINLWIFVPSVLAFIGLYILIVKDKREL